MSGKKIVSISIDPKVYKDSKKKGKKESRNFSSLVEHLLTDYIK